MQQHPTQNIDPEAYFDDDDQVLFQAAQSDFNLQQSNAHYSIYDSHPQNAFFNQQAVDCCNSQQRRVVTENRMPEQLSLQEHAATKQNQQALHQRQNSPIPGYQVVYTQGSAAVRSEHERSGFITSYNQPHKTKEQLNLNLLEQRRLSQRSPQRSLQSSSLANQVMTQQRRFTHAASPSCKQKMSPRTHQPSNWAITVPVAPRVTMNKMPTQPSTNPNQNDHDQFYERLMPSNGVFSQDELEKQSKSSNITSGISDDSVPDGVEEQQESQQQREQQRPYGVSNEQTESHASENLQFVLQPNEYLSFSQDRIATGANEKFGSQRGLVSQQVQSVATCRFGDDNANATGVNTQSSSVAKQNHQSKQQNVSMTSMRARVVSRSKQLNHSNHTARLVGGSAVDITVSSAFAHHTDHDGASEQPLKVVSQSQVKDFVKKQMEYEQAKALKIRQAMEEKQKKENAEFAKNATFRPTINRPKAITQTSLLKRKAQSPSSVKSRTFKQFLNDQNSYMFKTQRKVEEQRQKKFIEQTKEETWKPRMNPASEAICKKIQAEFYQQLMNKEKESCELSQTQGLIITDQSRIQNDQSMIRDNSLDLNSQGPPLMPRTANTSEIMPLMPTKAKKSPSNQIAPRQSAKKKPSPVAERLLAQKKALAKAIPYAPTFAPKINAKSQRIVKTLQKRCIMGDYGESPQIQLEQSKQQQDMRKLKSPKTPTERNTLVLSDNSANTYREAKIRIEESTSQDESQNNFLDGHDAEPPNTRVNKDEFKLPRTPQAIPQTARSDYSQVGFFNAASSHNDSMNASTNRSRMKTSKSPLNISNISSNTRQGPRIAEVKAFNEQLKTMQDKQQANATNKRYNENLVLRNFKKEFDAIMSDAGLGTVQIRDRIDIENPADASKTATLSLALTEEQKTLSKKDSDGTISTTNYFSAYSHEELSEEQVKVDIALVLFKLGFLNQISSPKDTSKSLLGIYEATLDDKEQKRAFKLNLFSVLNAIQAINLKDHFKLYSTFGVLKHHILEDITLQVDLSQLSHSNISPKSRLTDQHSQQQLPGSDTPCQVSQLIEALMNLALQPFPFSLNHSHLVKMHLTFMSFFLNRKDNISRTYRQNLKDQEEAKYKYSPSISHTQSSFSPNKQRTPLSEPNRYYDELKKNIKERAAKLSSLKAEKERKHLDECTFRPQVNPMSTKIAYKQVAELHVPQKEFAKTYMPVSEGTSSKEESDTKGSQRLLVQSPPPNNNSAVQQMPQSRLSNRINKLMNEYVQDKRSGKRQDITTEQKEYDQSKNELSFRPNIVKSQLSLALAVRKSPQLKLPQGSARDLQSVEQITHSKFPDLSSQRVSERLRLDQQQKSKTGLTTISMKRMASSPLSKPSSPLGGRPGAPQMAVKQKTIMFSRGPVSFAAAKGMDTYRSRLKQQVDKRKKSPTNTTKLAAKKKKTTNHNAKKQSPIGHIQINLDAKTSPSRNHEITQQQHWEKEEQEVFPSTIETIKRRETLQSYLQYDNSQSEMTHSDFFPEVSAYAAAAAGQSNQKSEHKKNPIIFVQGESDTVSQIDEETGVFGGGLNSLRAPPSVVDIMATKGQKESVSSSTDRNAGEINEDYVQMQAQIQESSDEFSEINENDLCGGNQYVQQVPQHHQESPQQWEFSTDPRIEFLLPIEEETKSAFETPQNQPAYQISHSQEGRIPFNTDMGSKEGNQQSQLPHVYRSCDRNKDIKVNRIDKSQTGASEMSAEIPSQLLMPRSNCNTDTPSPVYELQSKGKVFSADKESKVEWTSEFANVVQDMITINTCGSKVSDPNVYIGGGGEPAPLLRPSLKQSQLQQMQRYSRVAAEDRSVKKMGTEPDFKAPLQIVETLDEDQEIAYEKSLEQDLKASESSECRQEEEEENKGPVGHYHGSPAKSMNSQATSPKQDGQPYVYVNEESQSEEQQEGELEEEQKHAFDDSSIQLRMLGTDPTHQVDRESSDSMPRLYRANTNQDMDQCSEQRISLQPRIQHQISEQPRIFREMTNAEQNSSKGQSSGTTGENRSPKVAEFNDSSLISEVRISALDNFLVLREPSPDPNQIMESPLDYSDERAPSDR